MLLFGPLVFSAGSSLCFSNGDRDVGVRDFGLSFCLRVGYGSWEIFAVGTKYLQHFVYLVIVPMLKKMFLNFICIHIYSLYDSF